MKKIFFLTSLFIFLLTACENKNINKIAEKEKITNKDKIEIISGYQFINVNDDETRSVIDRNLQMCATYMVFENEIDKNFTLPTKMAIEYNRGKYQNLNYDFISKHSLTFDKITSKMIKLCNVVVVKKDDGREGKFIDAFPMEGYNTKYSKDDALRHSDLKLLMDFKPEVYRKMKMASEQYSDKFSKIIYKAWDNRYDSNNKSPEERRVINFVNKLLERIEMMDEEKKFPFYITQVIDELMMLDFTKDIKLGTAVILGASRSIKSEQNFYKILDEEYPLKKQ